jgi:hypothetical protein
MDPSAAAHHPGEAITGVAQVAMLSYVIHFDAAFGYPDLLTSY